ncbi:MAG: transcription-repair coupling factor, partial [Anaerovoracaceae bacterium]
GIGQFIGIEQLKVKAELRDYFKVKYKGEDALYVPVEEMDLIQKYIGANAATPKINRLSSGEWRQTKKKAQKAVEEMAKDLLELAAKRKAIPGHQFARDTVWQREFEDSFPYVETDDQIRSVEEIKRDMESSKAMDRLLCGDVGFGKTEVAARAIFKAAIEGKQVALLAPTTILASQHYKVLSKRFEDYPINVDMISRFRTESQQRKILNNLRDGKLDVIIGTHRLLSADVKFRDFGFLVIDEEQRFGVSHKEKIKKLRANIDVLSLSATPIPRTLHMSLVGIKEMSLIEEPPEDRYPVQTYVLQEDDLIIREAIEREIGRGGQVFIVVNRIHSINRIYDKITKLVPDISIAIGHGQMNERELEDVMLRFVSSEVDVLIATTIIESGIDIPNANTMIIYDADKFGLSQLYQLKGRVGRSNRLAYAYLVHKKNNILSEVSEKRLKAIKDFTEFGAGYQIAMRDLEIRGAGNLLGSEQHGHMINVGYEFYCRLVEEAMAGSNVKSIEEDLPETNIDIGFAAHIPEWYIGDEETKIEIYKKIADLKYKVEMSDLMDELLDRFGKLPKEVMNLIRVSIVRATSQRLNLRKVSVKNGLAVFETRGEDRHSNISVYVDEEKEPLDEVLIFLENMEKHRSNFEN